MLQRGCEACRKIKSSDLSFGCRRNASEAAGGRALVPATRTPANRSVSGSEFSVSYRKSLERRSAMRRRIRLAITAVVTVFLVWVLPAAAQAGITATAAD